MPRLRNDDSGVVVNVDGDTAARLVGKWSEVKDTAKSTSKPSARKSAASKSGGDK